MAELNSSPAKSGGKRVSRKMPVRVDLTAMVDLAFLLITFFMLTTSLIKPRVMPVVMPSDGPPGAVSEKTTMTILLGKNNHALWYLGMADKPLTTPKLIGYGKDMRSAIVETGKQVFASTRKPLMVIIKPNEHSIYDNLVTVLDEMDIIKVPTYAIAAIQPKDTELLKQKGIN
jgi:biopolymer transport protein ExbD